MLPESLTTLTSLANQQVQSRRQQGVAKLQKDQKARLNQRLERTAKRRQPRRVRRSRRRPQLAKQRRNQQQLRRRFTRQRSRMRLSAKCTRYLNWNSCLSSYVVLKTHWPKPLSDKIFLRYTQTHMWQQRTWDCQKTMSRRQQRKHDWSFLTELKRCGAFFKVLI